MFRWNIQLFPQFSRNEWPQPAQSRSRRQGDRSLCSIVSLHKICLDSFLKSYALTTSRSLIQLRQKIRSLWSLTNYEVFELMRMSTLVPTRALTGVSGMWNVIKYRWKWTICLSFPHILRMAGRKKHLCSKLPFFLNFQWNYPNVIGLENFENNVFSPKMDVSKLNLW